ncbi:MAG: hypothetical protein LBG58_07630 [Planctomycetaceae bacterium]|jgi:transcriptional regulator of met regulon|nr:hypothetical protein [Planctomycetaceae bacterium]
MTLKITDADLLSNHKPDLKIGLKDLPPLDPVNPRKSTFPAKNETLLLGGIAGGVLFLLIVAGVFFALSNDAKRNVILNPNPSPNPTINNTESVAINKVSHAVHQIFTQIGELNNNEKWQQLIQELRRVNLSSCPQDFRAAFMELIHGFENRLANIKEWEQFDEKITRTKSQINKEIKAHNENACSFDAFAEAVLRGFLGDPLGKYNDITQEENEIKAKINQLDRSFQSEADELAKKGKKITENINETLQKLERIAVQYNAKF